MADSIHIEVAWGDPGRQVLLALDVEAGTTLIEAIELSGILEQVPEIEVDAARLGVFSRKKSPLSFLISGATADCVLTFICRFRVEVTLCLHR